MPGVGAKHVVAQPVTQHEAHRQIVHRRLFAQPHPHLHGLAHAQHPGGALGIVHVHRQQHGALVARAHTHGRLSHGRSLGLESAVFALGHQRVVQVKHLVGRVVGHNAAAVQQHRAVAQAFDGARVMRHKHQRGALRPKLPNARVALVLKIHIAHRQCFVHDQHVRPQRGGHAERQAHLHAAGIGAHRLIDVMANFGKRLNVWHGRGNFVVCQAQQLR